LQKYQATMMLAIAPAAIIFYEWTYSIRFIFFSPFSFPAQSPTQ